MTGQVYQPTKWWDGRGIAARECTPMAARTTATVSFIKNHGLGWPLGTGELPSG